MIELEEYNCDLHFHSPYAGGVSKNMLIPVIAGQAKLKGLEVVSTADILNAQWFAQVKQNVVEESNGVFIDKKNQVRFIIGTEVQCHANVHHLIFLPDFATVENLKEKLKGTAAFDSYGCGRPRIRLGAEEIAEKVVDAGGIIGPAHAFTPYFSVYAHFSSVQECYKSMGKEINFIELGLSADSYFADMISENHNYHFLTASDSHSPWPHRVGREFTRIKMKTPDFKNLKKAFEEKEEALITLNVGLDPREGKYHCSACNQCFTKYPIKKAKELNWKCIKCGSSIKKGVRDRILELKDAEENSHPKFRPQYLHSIPLAEIIQGALNVQNVNAQKVQIMWAEFVDHFGSEINALIDAEEEELKKVNEKIAKHIVAFRAGRVLYIPGGGGNYGKPIVCTTKQEFEQKKVELGKDLECDSIASKQKTLVEF